MWRRETSQQEVIKYILHMELEMLSIVHSGQVALGRAGLDILGSPHNWHISVNIKVNIWRLSITNKY